MTTKNVLIFPCGAENAIEIHSALKDCVNIRLYGASSKKDHGVFIFKNYIGDIPNIDNPNFVNYLNEILMNNNIDVIIPTHDTVSLFLAKHRNILKCKVAVPDLETAKYCRYKSCTYDLFRDLDFCPIVYKNYENIVFPAFLKPDVGEGGKETRIIRDMKELGEFNFNSIRFLLTEYLPGEEVTVDCFTNRNGQLLFIGPRSRSRIMYGISVNSFNMPLCENVKHIAEKINERLSFRGLWFFQLKRNSKNEFKLLEISVRTAGTMNLFRNLGVNFPLLTIYDLFDIDVEILCNDYYIEVDRALFNRYSLALEYQTVYIDFDDTITKGGKANPVVMLFLYGEIRKGKIIKLITRHERDILQTLHELYIHENIFSEIIHLNQDQRKSDFIQKNELAIFIDNSFFDRADVKKRLGIPVFDVDAIQSLIDWHE